MVVLQTEAPPAIGAFCASGPRGRSEVQGGAQLGRQIAAEVLDCVHSDPIVKHGLHERVLCQTAGNLHGDRPSVDDMAYFAWVGMAPSPGIDVAHDYQVGLVVARGASTRGDRDQGVGCVGLERFASVLAAGAQLPAPPLSRQLDSGARRRLRFLGVARPQSTPCPAGRANAGSAGRGVVRGRALLPACWTSDARVPYPPARTEAASPERRLMIGAWLCCVADTIPAGAALPPLGAISGSRPCHSWR